MNKIDLDSQLTYGIECKKFSEVNKQLSDNCFNQIINEAKKLIIEYEDYINNVKEYKIDIYKINIDKIQEHFNEISKLVTQDNEYFHTFLSWVNIELLRRYDYVNNQIKNTNYTKLNDYREIIILLNKNLKEENYTEIVRILKLPRISSI